MFGTASFAQSPFASLAGTSFFESVTEAVTSADANSQQSNFVQAITEPITLSDINSNATGTFTNTTYTSTVTLI